MSETGTASANLDDESNPEDVAARLARLTREQGIGKLYGKFPQAVGKDVANQWASVLGFAHGQSADNNYSAAVDPVLDILVSPQAPPEIYEKMITDPDHQYWLVFAFNPRFQERTFEKSGWFGKKEVVKESVKSFKGKSLGDLAVQYEYHQPIDRSHDPSNRPGVKATMMVVVPIELAGQIDQQVSNDPLFPDKYFRALYPGILGQDLNHQIRRMPTIGLNKYDFRVNPRMPQMESIAYQQPLQD